jgi:putative flippase GtrA
MKSFIQKLDPRFLKFIFVGGVNTLFGYGLFTLFIFLNIHYAIASLLSTTLGVFFNFKTTGNLVFKSNNNRLIGRFISVYVIIYLLNVVFLKCLSVFNFNLYVSGAILILPLAIASFILNKKFVFNHSK